MKHGVQNSQCGKITGFFRNLLHDYTHATSGSPDALEPRSYPEREFARDLAYLCGRYRNEGLSFLTVTLPSLGKWFDQWLSSPIGEDPPVLTGFRPHKIHEGVVLPRFLFFFWCRFKAYRDTGTIPPGLMFEVKIIRSLLYSMYKLEVPFTSEQIEDGVRKWKECEDFLALHQLPAYYDEDCIRLREIVAYVFPSYLDVDVFENIEPRHGPGAVAGGEKGDGKWNCFHYYRSIFAAYSYADYLYPNAQVLDDLTSTSIVEWTAPVEIRDIAISKMVFVPKDSRGPRIICTEPKEFMFFQQGVARNMMRVAERRTRNHINFERQSINQNLAMENSISGVLATVDLKDASDRVSLKLVELLFSEEQCVFLRALRSTCTRLPDQQVVEHLKYAPMGSALCFPVESVIFYALAVLATGYTGGDPACNDAYVYGDDVILPSHVVDKFCQLCTKFGLMVNLGKTYASGPFRESCGVDALAGYDITPLRIRKDVFRASLDAPHCTALCEYSSNYYSAWMRCTGQYLEELAKRHFRPLVAGRKLGALFIVDPLRPFDYLKGAKWSVEACRLKVFGWDVKIPTNRTPIDSHARLLKNLYGSWEEHDPSKVADSRAAKIVRRNLLV